MKHLAFALLHGLGFSQRNLRDISPDTVEDVYNHLNVSLMISMGIGEERSCKIVDKRTVKYGEDVERLLQQLHVALVHRDDEDFPTLLRELPDCPTILYVRGVLPTHDANISIVGSRKHSQYAVSVLEKIIPDLVREGYGIISGGAYGIDSVAHSITLKNKGYTAAVFGSGIDIFYPPSNHALFDQILASGGGLISQFPLGTLAEPFNFPIRNALVAGISRGTLIAEAGEDSGTLITARLAVEANREVFVIPGDVTREGALGSNMLIRDGLGKLIISAADILSEYQIVDRQMSLLSLRPEFAEPLQTKIYEALCRDSMGIDMLSEKLDQTTTEIIHALSLLEIEGHVASLGGVYRVVK